jgi:hypothetical protein
MAIPDRDIIRHLAEHGDVIGRTTDGRVYLLLELDPQAFDRLCAAGADAEDLEDEPDQDGPDEPSLTPLHPLDRAA